MILFAFLEISPVGLCPDRVLIKVFFCTVFNLYQHLFDELLNSILSSVNLYRFSVLVVTTN